MRVRWIQRATLRLQAAFAVGEIGIKKSNYSKTALHFLSGSRPMMLPPWVESIIPFLKGALGWSAASFAVENFIKPSRARRQLARVLAEEVAQILQIAVHQAEYLRLEPNSVPGDFVLHSDVYRALTARVGELPDDVVGDLILFYQRVHTLNTDSANMRTLIDDVASIKSDPDRHGGLNVLAAKSEHLRRGMIVWREHFPVIIQQTDRVLRRLRIAETPFGRLGYWFRRKPTLDPEQVRSAVEARSAKLKT